MSTHTATHAEANQGAPAATSKTIAGPHGTKFVATVHGNNTTLTSPADPNQTIVIHLPPPGSGITADVSVSGIIGAIGDGLMEALGALKKILSCNPVTTTTVNVGSDGKVTSIVTTTACAA